MTFAAEYVLYHIISQLAIAIAGSIIGSAQVFRISKLGSCGVLIGRHPKTENQGHLSILPTGCYCVTSAFLSLSLSLSLSRSLVLSLTRAILLPNQSERKPHRFVSGTDSRVAPRQLIHRYATRGSLLLPETDQGKDGVDARFAAAPGGRDASPSGAWLVAADQRRL